jgi:hypothetical protein
MHVDCRTNLGNLKKSFASVFKINLQNWFLLSHLQPKNDWGVQMERNIENLEYNNTAFCSKQVAVA